MWILKWAVIGWAPTQVTWRERRPSDKPTSCVWEFVKVVLCYGWWFADPALSGRPARGRLVTEYGSKRRPRRFFCVRLTQNTNFVRKSAIFFWHFAFWSHLTNQWSRKVYIAHLSRTSAAGCREPILVICICTVVLSIRNASFSIDILAGAYIERNIPILQYRKIRLCFPPLQSKYAGKVLIQIQMVDLTCHNYATKSRSTRCKKELSVIVPCNNNFA